MIRKAFCCNINNISADKAFSTDLSAREKKRALSDDFNIEITEQISEEVLKVCNLSIGVLNKGREQGENMIITLMQELFAAGRSSDAEKASNDAEYRRQLLKEFGLDKN